MKLKKLKSFFKSNPYFLQIGANDGINYDPIYNLVLEYNIVGIFFEPLKTPFDQLIINYQKHKRYSELQFYNECVSDINGEKTFYHLDNNSRRYLAMGRCSSLLENGNDIVKHKDSIKKIKVKSSNLQTIYDRSYSKIDFIQIDVEGYEWHIIKQLNDVEYLPTVIHFEKKHIPTHEYDLLWEFLTSRGYNIRTGDSKGDRLAIRK